MDFTRETIVEALTEVGETLYRRRKIGDIAMFGGSAMILQFNLDFVTQDIDAIIQQEHGEVISAVHDVARRRGWPTGWLNEGVSVYLSAEHAGAMTLYGEFPNSDRVGLRVYVAKPEYLLAMKLRALRVGRRDIDDVVTLARHLGVRTIEGLSRIVARNFPNEPLDARKLELLTDVVRKIGA